MTDTPESRVTPPARSRSAGGVVRTIIAWVLLMAIAGAMVLGHSWRDPAASEAGTPTTVETVDPEQVPDAMLTLIARYVVGVKPLLGSGPAAGGIGGGAMGGLGDLGKSLEDAAQTPLQRLRAAMVLGELKGAEAARERIDTLVADGKLDEGLARDAAIARAALADADKPARDLISAEDAERLTKRHHWFARVLLSHGLAETDPTRIDALASAARAVKVLFTGLAVAAIGFFVGFVLGGIGLFMLLSRSLRPAFRPLREVTLGQNASLLESLVIFLVLLTGVGLASHLIEDRLGVDVQVWMLWLALGAAAWPLLWRVRAPDLRRALGWHSGKGVLREVGAGIVGYLGGLPIVALGLGTTIVLIIVTGSRPSHPVVEQAAAGGGWWEAAKLMILATLWAPICEETLFRGAAYTHCRRWMHPLLSTAIVAFIFAAIHPQGWAVVPALMSLAVVFGLIREWRGSLIACVTAHALQNAFVMTLNLLLLRG